MYVHDGGGSTPIQTYTPTPSPAPATVDAEVREAVDRTLEATQFGQPTDGAQAAYQIEQTLARSDLTQDQKDAYIAEIVQLAGSGIGATKCVDERTSEKLLHGLNDIGVAWTGAATSELRDQVTAAVGRATADGLLDSNDLYNLVSEPGSHGARELLTGVRDGTALANVAQRLVSDARSQGYDINDSQTGPQTLTAAADIANMAASYGNRSAANAVLAEIARVGDAPVAGDDMMLPEAMMATTVGGGQWGTLPERDGFHALSGLLNSVSQTDRNQPAQDALFADLVRSGGEGYVGGLDQAGERGAALDDLGTYFNANAGRLAEADWRAANTGGDNHLLVQDFMQNVMLDPDYGLATQTQDTIATEVADLAEVVGDTTLPEDDRLVAATTLGGLLGSLETAGEKYIADERGDAEARVGLVRQFTDQITDKLIGKLQAKLPEGAVSDGAGTAANNLVDQLWNKLTDWQTQGAIDHTGETTGGLVEMVQEIREAMANGDANVINAFDDREDLYHDG